MLHHEIDERFTLTNPDQKPTFWKCQPGEKKRQTVLFSGMDCLAGQRDLFATDGKEQSSEDK